MFAMRAEDIAEGIRILETEIPSDVVRALESSLRNEEGLGRDILTALLENIRLAKEASVPVCQDTGSLIFFVHTDEGCAEIYRAVREGVSLATGSVPLRANIVDPFSRRNTGNNLGRGSPVVHFEPSCGGGTRIEILAKGAGSENTSAATMLDPDQSSGGIRDFVVQTVKKAGAKPCPPVVVGVGVGSTLDGAVTLSKRALLRRIDDANPDARAMELEAVLLQEVNSLGIGPMGFGGKTTALGVKVEVAECHTASLPVGVSVQCWALRRVVIEEEGTKAVVRRF